MDFLKKCPLCLNGLCDICLASTTADGATEASAYVPECALAVWVRGIVDQKLRAERARAAAEESATWSRCFGSGAAPTEKAQRARIVAIASARALLATMKTPLRFEQGRRQSDDAE